MNASILKQMVLMICFACALGPRVAQGHDVLLDGGEVLRVEPVSTGIIRIRLSDNGLFPESLMERYQIVRRDWPAFPSSLQKQQDGVMIETAFAVVSVRRSDGTITLKDRNGRTIIDRIEPLLSKLDEKKLQRHQARLESMAEYFRASKTQTARQALWGEWNAKPSQVLGAPDLKTSAAAAVAPTTAVVSKPFGMVFSLKDPERFYGLGAATPLRIQLRGHGYRNWVEYQGEGGFDSRFAKFYQTEGPIPFLMSTGGWGIFINTSFLHFLDIGRYEPDQMAVWAPRGNLDFFLLSGEGLPALIERYTEITGKPILLPRWGYGLTYVGNMLSNQYEILNDALMFRDRGIPCDIIGLEPQWMKNNYDASRQKTWNSPGKFYMEYWVPRAWSMVGALDRMGYKLSVWLCCDDDLTLEEERQVAVREGRPGAVPDEPDAWFGHLHKFMNQGVAAFKVDPSSTINVHTGRAYYNKRDDLEMHNLMQTLMLKQMYLGFRQFAQRRPMIHYCGAYAGTQHWGALNMGDNGGETKALAWMLGYSLSGQMNLGGDMAPHSDYIRPGAGMHFNFFMPWSQLNNWAFAWQPWYLGPKGERMFREYAQLRSQLAPYIYSAAHTGVRTGMPIVRAMPLMYPDDLETSDSSRQYMFGDFLLVGAFEEDIYLPRGRWIDYWTGQDYTGPKRFKPVIPDGRGGSLFVKAGAIIPFAPLSASLSAPASDTLILRVWPEGNSDYTLYEDDGESLEYEKGAVAITRIACRKNGGHTTLNINPRESGYKDMPASRLYEICVHLPEPRQIKLNGKTLDRGKKEWSYDFDAKAARLTAREDPERRQPIVVEIASQ
ncbi:MAG: DUF5110 domain-containing protein [Candidatus Sumerlaeota bacterium]|nr:DUF5110 domain-containing protein [Candidatus Sumerlaeota bacterium]